MPFSQAQEKQLLVFAHKHFRFSAHILKNAPMILISPIRSITSTDFIQEMLRRIKLAIAPSNILNLLKNADSLIQVDFMSISTLNVALNASSSASILTVLKGAKIALECRSFDPEGAHCIREAPRCCRESQKSSGRSSEIPPDAAGASKSES